MKNVPSKERQSRKEKMKKAVPYLLKIWKWGRRAWYLYESSDAIEAFITGFFDEEEAGPLDNYLLCWLPT